MKARTMCLVVLTTILACSATIGRADELADLKARVAAMEARLADLENSLKPVIAQVQSADRRVQQQREARRRMQRDLDAYTEQELREIESLYQVANKKWQTEEARASLQTLVEKYKKANRTGCAILYLGQMSQGEEQLAYLKQAIADHGDCFYGDGVQVGAYARYVFGHVYLKRGDTAQAGALFEEIRRDFPDAVDHQGNSLVSQLPR